MGLSGLSEAHLGAFLVIWVFWELLGDFADFLGTLGAPWGLFGDIRDFLGDLWEFLADFVEL